MLSHDNWEGGRVKKAKGGILLSRDPKYHGSLQGNDFLDWLDPIKCLSELNRCVYDSNPLSNTHCKHLKRVCTRER